MSNESGSKKDKKSATSEPAVEKMTKREACTTIGAANFEAPKADVFLPQAYLLESEIALIKAQMPLLIKAEYITDMPWEALAAVWYRENSLLVAAQNKFQGGPMCFDPAPKSPQLY